MWFVACLCLNRRHSQDLQYRQLGTLGEHAAPGGAYRETTRFACSVPWRISLSRPSYLAGDGCLISKRPKMSTEIRNWDVVAKAMEAAGATSSEMYVRAKALALGKLDPMPTSSPEAPYSISAVAG